jgi:hypothetical protein
MVKNRYDNLEDPEAGAAAPASALALHDAAPSRGRALHDVAGSLGPAGEPVLHLAAEAFAEDAAHRSPMLDGGDLPLRALAQGLSMLSIEELRRLRLPAMPWQDKDGPSMWEGLKKTPWKAHYTNVIGFVISTGAAATKSLMSTAALLCAAACSAGGVRAAALTRLGVRRAGALIAHLWAAVVACLLIVFVSQVRRRRFVRLQRTVARAAAPGSTRRRVCACVAASAR